MNIISQKLKPTKFNQPAAAYTQCRARFHLLARIVVLSTSKEHMDKEYYRLCALETYMQLHLPAAQSCLFIARVNFTCVQGTIVHYGAHR